MWKDSLVCCPGELGPPLHTGLTPAVRASPSLGLRFPSDLQGPSGPDRIQPGSASAREQTSL